jgi:transaldolase
MRKAGVSDYESFAREILQAIPDRPISFKVFADDFTEMARQARKIATWGANNRVKIPITNTRRESALPLCERLTQEGIPLNVTALFTLEQVQAVVDAVKGGAPAYVSVFAGGVADTGVDPVPLMAEGCAAASPLCLMPSLSGQARASCSISFRQMPSVVISSILPRHFSEIQYRRPPEPRRQSRFRVPNGQLPQRRGGHTCPRSTV